MTYLSRRYREIREEEERRKAGWSTGKLKVQILPKGTVVTTSVFHSRLAELGRKMPWAPAGYPYPVNYKGRGA